VKFVFLLLGGLGENGKNMYVIEVDKQLFILDAGINIQVQSFTGLMKSFQIIKY